ncbi:hypothetical protein SK3146_00184 [Paenibacillus konkukensis]|uniref:Uncharacterized protein n=1 Tax=Paenibacillus konkukensis TaxID=2020716 RepID=A0ABY4RHN0_9BACL|nr:hypothetical protein [Paenibacillus konkukensis]UQZ81028.1 hypothetical protein SK3146_00184 [Paenibacillus konkukensis]
MPEDKVIEEKMNFEKASWELPETEETEASADQIGEVPSNYENLSTTSYTDATTFEVKKTPGRL